MREYRMGSDSTRRTYLKAAGAAGLVGLAGCLGDDDSSGGDDGNGGGDGSGGNGDGYHIGISPLYLADDWMTAWTTGCQWYGEDLGMEVSVANGENDPATQTQACQNLIQQGIDGLVLSPVDSEASATIVDRASEEDIPVVLSNTMSVHEDSKMFVAFDNYAAAGLAAEQVVDYFEEEYGEPSGRVLELQIPLRLETGAQRHEGFVDHLADYPDIEVELIETDATPEDAQTKATNLLRSDDDFQAIYAGNPNTMQGGLNALDQHGMKNPLGNDDHVFGVVFAANPTMIEEMEGGYLSAAINQTPLFYGPIGMEYMREYLENDRDESVWPEIGTEVTEDDMTISGNERQGVNPWQRQLWSPATVKDIQEDFPSARESYPYFQTSALVVDETNYDEPWLWGNMADLF